MLTGAVSVFDRSSTQKGRMNALFFPFSCLFVRVTLGILATGDRAQCVVFCFSLLPFLSLLTRIFLYNWCAVVNTLAPFLGVFKMLPVVP